LDVRGEEPQDGKYYGLHEQVIGWTFRLESRTRVRFQPGWFRKANSTAYRREDDSGCGVLEFFNVTVTQIFPVIHGGQKMYPAGHQIVCYFRGAYMCRYTAFTTARLRKPKPPLVHRTSPGACLSLGDFERQRAVEGVDQCRWRALHFISAKWCLLLEKQTGRARLSQGDVAL
jgi:hypothetical protein